MFYFIPNDVYSCIAMDIDSSPLGHILIGVAAAIDYCSLVDRRCRDLIHGMRAASAYRIERLTRMNGGPSPRRRALASQERLTFKRTAASFGVSTSCGLFIAVARGRCRDGSSAARPGKRWFEA